MSIISLSFSVVILGYFSSILQLYRNLETLAYDHMSACSLYQVSGQLGNALLRKLEEINTSEVTLNETILRKKLEECVGEFRVKADKTLNSFGIKCEVSIAELSFEGDAAELTVRIFLLDYRRNLGFSRYIRKRFIASGE